MAVTTGKNKTADRPGLMVSLGIMGYYARRYPGRAAVVVVCLLASGLAEGLGITLFLPVIQVVIGEDSGIGTGWFTAWLTRVGLPLNLGSLLGLMVVFMAIKAVLLWFGLNQVGYTIARVAMDMRLDLIRTLLRVRWSYFIREPAGQFANAMSSEAIKAANCFLVGAELLSSIFLLLIYLGLAFQIAWFTALAGLIAGLVFMFLVRGLVKRARAAGKRQIKLLRSVSGRLVDFIHGIKPLKAMAREHNVSVYMEREMATLNDAKREEVRATVSLNALQEPILVAIMATGLYLVVNRGMMPFPVLLVQAFLFSRIFNQMGKLTHAYQKLVVSESAFLSIQGRINSMKAQREDVVGHAPPSLRKGIYLRSVSFAYGENPVLNEIDLHVPARQWTALVGPSGSGKTTLTDLIAGLHVPVSGQICIDETPLTSIDLMAWRHRIGYVPQEMLMLHASICDNIALGDPAISRTSVEDALKLAGAWSFVSAFPDGIETMVGERGARLSGGQRQRIALARALVHKPELLILDEASASLDPASEQALCQTLRELSRTTTILSISHQPAIAQAADRIYSVDKASVRRIR